YSVSRVRDVRRSPGAARPATTNDRPLLSIWMRAFRDEALSEAERDDEGLDRGVEARLAAGFEYAGLWLWEDAGAAVSMAGYGGRTSNGVRVGPVYTPPRLRGRGYATNLVARLSAWLLESGRSFCFLYTDLANPTSNRIYEDIGYERVCDSADYRFEPATA
ncbi:MAG: GNAT family N-acetyltransferase, partial [Candidatus Limnocylindria bacterium]